MASPRSLFIIPGGKGHNPRYFGPHGKSLICDRPHRYDCYVAPFFGGGGDTFGHYHGCIAAIGGDVDPGVLAVARCWGDEEGRRFVSCELQDWWDKINENGGTVYADRQAVFDDLKFLYEDSSRCTYREYAAAYLTLKRLVFGGILRTNKQGKLNVALSQDKLQSYLENPSYEWPDNGIERLDIHHGWERAVQALADSDYTNALVTIDPPYYSPERWTETRKDGTQRASKMTAAYPGHNPQSADELALCVDCLDAVLATGKAGRIVVFNYWSKILDDMLQDALIKYQRFDFHFSRIGYLGGMNNAQQFHGRDIEAVWEIGGTRMFQDFDAAQQLNLVDV